MRDVDRLTRNPADWDRQQPRREPVDLAALRHTPEHGRVELACAHAGDDAVFSVTDTGPGIAPADLPRLFTPLYRGEGSRNRATGGTGLA